MTNLNLVYVYLADYLIYLMFLAAAFLRLAKVKIPLIVGISAASLSGIISTLIKDFYYLPRPFVSSGQPPLIDIIMDGSFPSSHTAVSFALGLAIFLKNRLWGGIFLIFAFFVAIGRAGSGVHSVRDLIGGVIIAVFSVYLTHILVKKIKSVYFRD